MNNREEIASIIRDEFENVAKWFEGLADDKYLSGPTDKWTAAEHLDHLVRSCAPLNKALRLPKIGPRILFGKAKAPSRDYDGVVAAYRATLDAGGAASGQFVPVEGDIASKDKLIATYRREGERLAEVAQLWSESDLDTYVLPHPLIGKMTVRELLLFTIYHTRHHLNTLETDYA